MVIFLIGLVSMVSGFVHYFRRSPDSLEPVPQILMRTLRKDYARYSKDEDMNDLERDLGDEYGWKQIHGDVFRSPSYPMMLSVFVGTGYQIATVTFFVIIFAIFGSVFTVSSNSRRSVRELMHEKVLVRMAMKLKHHFQGHPDTDHVPSSSRRLCLTGANFLTFSARQGVIHGAGISLIHGHICLRRDVSRQRVLWRQVSVQSLSFFQPADHYSMLQSVRPIWSPEVDQADADVSLSPALPHLRDCFPHQLYRSVETADEAELELMLLPDYMYSDVLPCITSDPVRIHGGRDVHLPLCHPAPDPDRQRAGSQPGRSVQLPVPSERRSASYPRKEVVSLTSLCIMTFQCNEDLCATGTWSRS